MVYAKLRSMRGALRRLFAVMPFLFGIGFIAPLTAQLLSAAGLQPFGLSPVAFGLAFGAAWGLYANIKGRWL
jgi:hypothetical protein